MRNKKLFIKLLRAYRRGYNNGKNYQKFEDYCVVLGIKRPPTITSIPLVSALPSRGCSLCECIRSFELLNGFYPCPKFEEGKYYTMKRAISTDKYVTFYLNALGRHYAVTFDIEDAGKIFNFCPMPVKLLELVKHNSNR